MMVKRSLVFFLSMTSLISACSNSSVINREQNKTLTKTLTTLVIKNYIDQDSANKIISYYASLDNDSSRTILLSSLQNALIFPAPQKKINNNISSTMQMSKEEYYNFFKTKYDSIKLTKRFGQAPLYGQYADALANIMNEIDNYQNEYSVLDKDIRLKKLYKTIDDKNNVALKNYLKYGEPDEDLLHIKAACEMELEEILKDPDYEILKDMYYLKQTNKGYDYKLLVRGKNSFGASIQQEIIFSLVYEPVSKMYIVTSTR